MTTLTPNSDQSVEGVSDDHALMNAVREHQALYDRNTSAFKDKDRKANAWKEVSSSC